jgi:hypothetical protein
MTVNNPEEKLKVMQVQLNLKEGVRFNNTVIVIIYINIFKNGLLLSIFSDACHSFIILSSGLL